MRADEFRNLTSLCLREMNSRGYGLSVLSDIPENFETMQHLCLAGFVGNDSFDVILQCHVKTLHSLHIDARDDFQENNGHKPSGLLIMSMANVQRISES